jgi:hypothetical protein
MALSLGGDNASASLGDELDESRDELSPGDIIEWSTKNKKVRVMEGESEGGMGHFYTSQPVNPEVR